MELLTLPAGVLIIGVVVRQPLEAILHPVVGYRDAADSQGPQGRRSHAAGRPGPSGFAPSGLVHVAARHIAVGLHEDRVLAAGGAGADR